MDAGKDRGDTRNLKLLIVEDSPDDVELLLAELQRGGFVPETRRVDTPEAMRTALQTEEWDLIVADYSMPRFSATAALRVLRSTGMDLPFIIVSGTIGEATAVAAMKAGAHDYIVKHDLARLVPAIQRELREANVRRMRNAAEAQLIHLAHHDPLTGLPNRIVLLNRLKQAMYEADRYARLVAILFLDLDRFKSINDTLGHTVGDDLLKGVAERLKGCVRDGDLVARLGGDEFAIILADLDKAESAAGVAEKILDQFVQPFQAGLHELHTTASLGISVYPRDSGQLDELLKNADAAMYSAKSAGRNTWRFFTRDLGEKMLNNMALENGLRKALSRNELELRYQPMVDLRRARVTGAEALVYWQHPEHGLLRPGTFISLAEETGLIAPIGDWVLQEVCRQARDWHACGFGPLRLSFNVSPLQFNSRRFPGPFTDALARSGVPAEWFGVELTENTIMQQPDLAATTLSHLTRLGVWVGIDDFGTGYSNLSYLKKFPVSAIKIDMSFIQGVPDKLEDVAIVKAVIGMAHNLGLEVVAEGVETMDQLAFLQSNECDLAQGFLFNPPLTASQCETALRDNRWSQIAIPMPNPPE